MAANSGLERIALVAPRRGPVEDPVVAHQELDPAPRGRISLVDGAVMEREDAHRRCRRTRPSSSTSSRTASSRPTNAGCGMLGYTRSELLATPVSHIHPADLPQLRRFLDRVLRDGQGSMISLTCRTKGDDAPRLSRR